MRKSPVSYSGRFSSITSPTRSPRAARALSPSAEKGAAISVRRRSSAGLPASSSTAVALAAGDHRLVSDRPGQPCETTVKTGGPQTRAPTAPSLCTASSWISACVPGPAPAGGDPAYKRDPVRAPRSGSSGTDPAGNVEGINEQRDDARGRRAQEWPCTVIPSSVCSAAGVGNSTPAPLPAAHPPRRPLRFLLELADPGDHSLSDAAEREVPRRELPHGATSAAASTSSQDAPVRGTRTARSTASRPRTPPRASRAAFVAASHADCEVDRPAPIRHASAPDVICSLSLRRPGADPLGSWELVSTGLLGRFAAQPFPDAGRRARR